MRSAAPGKFTTRLLPVRPASCGILPRGAFDEHALDGADHALADRARLRLQLRLEALQPLQLHVPRGWVGQLSRGRAGPRAVEEGKGGIEADVAGQLQGGFEIAVGLAAALKVAGDVGTR